MAGRPNVEQYDSPFEDFVDALFRDGPSRVDRRLMADNWSKGVGDDESIYEVAGEMDMSPDAVGSVNPYDERWGQVWARAYDIRKERGGEDHDPADDQQAFKEIFGK